MSKGGSQTVTESAHPGAASPAEDLKVLVLGDGFPAASWMKHLAEVNANAVHVGRGSKSVPPWSDPDVIIETEDIRFLDDAELDMHGHDHGDSGEGPSGHNGHNGQNGHGPADFRGMEIEVPEGSIVLAPCYGVAPSQIAAAFGESEGQVIGYTFFPKPERAKEGNRVIEIGRALQTSEESWTRALEVLETLGLRAEIAGDAPGFVFARTLACLVNEAARALADGIASPTDIDNAMKLGVNYPKGLFEWADEFGIELIYDILRGLCEHYEEDRYRPAPLLKNMLAAGKTFADLQG